MPIITIITLHATKWHGADVNGDNPGVHLDEPLRVVVDELRGSKPPDYHQGGAGGSVLSGAFIRLLEAQPSRRRDWVGRIYAAKGKAWSDQIITILAYALNGTVGGWPGYAEKW